jgi:indolepyruvate ferredoxin oxidoreductase alpha subunit
VIFLAKQLLMGNEAIARGAVEAGLNVAVAYPGTPSSEIIGTLAKWAADFAYYVEWSVNEKVALEVAAGAAYAGANCLVAMKQVGLNVAGDPLMSLAYIGVKGALVLAVADDPGPHSSQTEQDTRTYAKFAKLPVFDPASPEEALEMTKAALDLSHRYGLPVFLRPTTRVCHATAGVEFSEVVGNQPEGFVKDPRWVIFPKLANLRHQWLESQLRQLAAELAASRWNRITPGGQVGIVAGGIAYHYAVEAAELLGFSPTVLKIGNPHPLPVSQIEAFLAQVDRVVVCEELDPVLEEGVRNCAGKIGFTGPIAGKMDGVLPYAGEYNVDLVRQALRQVLGLPADSAALSHGASPPELPARPPVFCAGCPHRAAFYAVKKAAKGTNAIYTGDIGCYTLGNAAPLQMVDTCLCMGAGVTVAQGLRQVEPGRPVFAFIGDSTFFHSGIPGLINAVYNRHRITLVLLDNRTTAMTGHQPHPGIGRNAVGEVAEVIDAVALIKACGVGLVIVVDPLDLTAAEAAVKQTLDYLGVAALVMRSPCAALAKTSRRFTVDQDQCINCRRCITELGCPAYFVSEKPQIGPSCHGCGLCAQLCPVGAIKEAQS